MKMKSSSRGLVPAAPVALLIDDLVDTGKTAQVARRLLPKAHFACLYAKPAGRPIGWQDPKRQARP